MGTTNPITAFGETKSRSQWAHDKHCAVTLSTLRRRLRSGWAPQDAIAAPAWARPPGYPGRPAKPGSPRATAIVRRERIRELSLTLCSMAELADTLNVTRQRIHQLLKRMSDGEAIKMRLAENRELRDGAAAPSGAAEPEPAPSDAAGSDPAASEASGTATGAARPDPAAPGAPCVWCSTPFEAGEERLLLPCVRRGPRGLLTEDLPWHRECNKRLQVGSLAHLERRCSCCGGVEERVILKPQEKRAEAIEVWRRVMTGQ